MMGTFGHHSSKQAKSLAAAGWGQSFCKKREDLFFLKVVLGSNYAMKTGASFPDMCLHTVQHASGAKRSFHAVLTHTGHAVW